MTEQLDTSAAAIAALLDGVTPGPWRHGAKYDSVVADNATGHDDQDTIDAYGGNLVCESAKRPPNQRFIAAARDLVPALSAKLTALRGGFEYMQRGQTYRYIGKDGKPILARDLEDQRDVALERVNVLEAALKYYDGHQQYPNDGPWGVNSTDFGDVARAALAKGETI